MSVRVTSGPNSKQDYQTPADFKEAVEKRFGKIGFDLAAHAKNTLCESYYAPMYFTHKTKLEVHRTKDEEILLKEGWKFVRFDKKKQIMHFERDVPNIDPKAFKQDALECNWNADLTGWVKGICWLNCEFDDCETWAKKCAETVKESSRLTIALLTPASVGANWARDWVFPFADIYMLNGRICFDGKDPYPKDCMLSIFMGPDIAPARDHIRVGWDWRNDLLF